MIWAIVQISALILAALKLASFDGRGHRYRFMISLVATVMAGSCTGLSAAMILNFPEAVSYSNVFTAILAGAYCGLIYWANGNVAVLLRTFRLIRE